MWLSIASGLGISIGVMLILATTPRAYPPGLPQTSEVLLLASIYLGGAVIGLAYVCYVLTQSASAKSGVTSAIVQRYTGLLFILVLARAGVISGSACFSDIGLKPRPNPNNPYYTDPFLQANAYHLEPWLLGLAVFVLPLLALFAERATRLSSRILPSRRLAALILLGILTEILARFLVL
jgi:hypothetical protein